MLHAAIYRAPAGSVVVVEAGGDDYALAGGNVCAVAQRNGIAGFVLDGAVRDVAEIRALQFPLRRNIFGGHECAPGCNQGAGAQIYSSSNPDTTNLPNAEPLSTRV